LSQAAEAAHEAFLIDCRSGARGRKRLGNHEQRLQERPSLVVRYDAQLIAAKR
jgi:hypothetical protein